MHGSAWLVCAVHCGSCSVLDTLQTTTVPALTALYHPLAAG